MGSLERPLPHSPHELCWGSGVFVCQSGSQDMIDTLIPPLASLSPRCVQTECHIAVLERLYYGLSVMGRQLVLSSHMMHLELCLLKAGAHSKTSTVVSRKTNERFCLWQIAVKNCITWGMPTSLFWRVLSPHMCSDFPTTKNNSTLLIPSQSVWFCLSAPDKDHYSSWI